MGHYLTGKSQSLTRLGCFRKGESPRLAWSFVTKDCLVQRWLDLSSRGFLFVFPKGADLPVTFTLVIIKSTGEMHSGASSSSSPTLPESSPRRLRGPSVFPYPAPLGLSPPCPGRPWNSFLPDPFVHPVSPGTPPGPMSCRTPHRSSPAKPQGGFLGNTASRFLLGK